MSLKAVKKIDKVDLRESFNYFVKSFTYSFFIGSAVIAIARNYKKAMLNEESFAAYKFFREMQYESDIE
jgi:hypothetical protein